MEENKENIGNNGGTPTAEGEGTPTKQSFDDLLKEPEYQAEFDKKVAKALDKAKAKWQKDAEDQKTEAERLATLTSEEKAKEALDKANKETAKAVAELNAYKLKEEAQKIATEKGMDITLLDLIDYSKETAESVKTKIDTMDSTMKKVVEKTVEERLRQPSPKQVNSQTKTSDKSYLDEKYKDNPFYNKG